MNVIYENPTKTWIIAGQKDNLWQQVFGREFFWYNISKKSEENEEYILIHSTVKLETAFRWLKSNNIISNDEMLQQIHIVEREQNETSKTL